MELCPSQSSSEGFCCLGKKLFTTVVLSTFEKGYARPGEEKTLLGGQSCLLKLEVLLRGGIRRCQDDEPSDRVPEQLAMWRCTSGSSQLAVSGATCGGAGGAARAAQQQQASGGALPVRDIAPPCLSRGLSDWSLLVESRAL